MMENGNSEEYKRGHILTIPESLFSIKNTDFTLSNSEFCN